MSWMTLLSIVAVGAGLVAAAVAFTQRAPASAEASASSASAQAPDVISATEAHQKASRGHLVLVDVRTPQEWLQTGVPASAHAVTMNQDGATMLAAIDKLVGNDRGRPLAIICRTGNRTGSLLPQLRRAGFTNVTHVGEGVAGSRHGAGWLKAGLPMRPGTAPGKPVIASQ